MSRSLVLRTTSRSSVLVSAKVTFDVIMDFLDQAFADAWLRRVNVVSPGFSIQGTPPRLC